MTSHITLRPHQAALIEQTRAAWEAAQSVLLQLPTGGGKTVILARIIRETAGAVCAIAHRRELVSQISLALAREGVRHRVIGPREVVQFCARYHVEETGRSYYDASSAVAVASVDTLVAREADLRAWASSVRLWVQDEAHHVLTGNKWGLAAAMFPQARGLGVTATPGRADGRGLGRHADGVFDALVSGPGMRELIGQGYLTDYRVFCPPSDLDMTGVPVSKTTGDFSLPQMRKRAHESHIVGDVVEQYRRIAPGKLGVTFAPDVELAEQIAAQYCAAGVPAEAVSANTDDATRTGAIRRFRRRQILQLVNVDLFGEGFDLPAIEVVSFARPTQSYNVYAQQFGRALRPMDGKAHAIVIDHVGNVLRHGLPDAPRVWTLDARKRRQRENPGAIPVRTCPACYLAYEAHRTECPYCGVSPQRVPRSRPSEVDGDLYELTPEALAALRSRADAVLADTPPELARLQHGNAPAAAVHGYIKAHRLRRDAQRALRDAMAQWAGVQRDAGLSERERHRKFFHAFGIDSLSAQALGRPEADALRERILERMEK
jgi:superfamily II DNA or RNA helicase